MCRPLLPRQFSGAIFIDAEANWVRALLLLPQPTAGSVRTTSEAMEQLNYDEIRLLRELKNSERRIASNKLDARFERLVDEGYATTSLAPERPCAVFLFAHFVTGIVIAVASLLS
jgi:hypothetical protein